MSNGSAEDIAQLEALASIWRRRLRLLDIQLAKVAGNPSASVQLTLEHEDAERQLAQVLVDLRRAHPGPVADRSPYLGLLTFQEAQADLFFGRDALVAELVERVRHVSFLAVLGASGSGKSSIVRAGLLAMLKSGALPGSATWRYIVLKPGARPLDALAAELAKLAAEPTAVIQYRETLGTGERALLLLSDALLDRAHGQRLVLVVDQFEELWTQAPTEPVQRDVFIVQQQRPFIRLLLTAGVAPDTPLLIILAMRADFLHRAAEEPQLARAISEHDVIVSPMASDELHDAILRPAELAGGSFEPGLVDALIEQVLGRPGALPLLEYTLAELWRMRQPDGTMTWDDYRTLGGVEGALAARADALLGACYTPDQQEEIRDVLLRLVQPGEGVADTRRRVRLDDLVSAGESRDAFQALLAPLTDARLLTTGGDSASGEETVEISHEALIRAWPTLGRWIGEARANLRFQLQLETAAQEWQASGENPDLLWDGLRLSNAVAWLARARPRLNLRDQAFLDASKKAEQSQAAAEEAARQRELINAQALAEVQRQRAEEQIIARRRLRQGAIFLAGALICAIGAAIAAGWFGVAAQNSATAEQAQKATAQALAVAEQQQKVTAVAASQQAERAATLALARQLIAQAERDARTQSDRAMLFSIEATRLTNERAARGTLLSVLVANERLVGFVRGDTAAVRSMAFSPDGKTLASASDDYTIRLWDVASRQLRGVPLTGHSGSVLSVAFSPDGKTLASASFDRTIRLWDVASRQPRGQPLYGHTDAVWSVVFSPDGKTLASTGFDGTVRLWDVATGQSRGELPHDHTDAAYTVAFSPDGTTLASGGDDRTIRLWDVATGQLRGEPLHGHTATVFSVAFSPDGKTLASAGDDHTIRLWDVATGQLRGEPLHGHTGTVWSVAFSPDGKTLASASNDGSTRLWDLASRQPRGEPLQGHTAAVFSVAFSPDGTLLASASSDRTIQLWDVANRQPLGVPLTGHTNAVNNVAFSPDGKTLASASDDHTIRLWDVANRQPRGVPLTGHTDAVNSVAFSPDGKTLASAGRDHTIRLWDVATGQPRGEPLQGHTDAVYTIAFSPDGTTLASAGTDIIAGAEIIIGLWDVLTHQSRGLLFNGHTASVNSVAFSPDGKTLASASDDGTVRLWDVATGQPRGEPLIGHTNQVWSVVFSPDGKTLASAGRDRTVRLWDVATGQPRGEPLQGHTDVVTSLAFSPDGTTLASAGFDGTIQLWDVTTGQPFGEPLQGHTDTVTSLAFSPDGMTLAAASDDHTVRLWDLNVETWIARACQIAGRNLTRAEWNQFVSPDRPYHRTCSEFPPGEGAPLMQ